MEHKSEAARPTQASQSPSTIAQSESQTSNFAGAQRVPHTLARPTLLSTGDVLLLQRSAGNRAVQQLLSGARANSTPPPILVQRHSIKDREEHEVENEAEDAGGTAQLQRKTSGGLSNTKKGGLLDANLDRSIRTAKGRGKSLGDPVRGHMENAFGSTFSDVRIHADAQADRISRSIQARAFTTGKDIFFANGEYNPSSAGGQKLIAHELTHVVQQTGKAPQIGKAPQTGKVQRRERAMPKLANAAKQGIQTPAAPQPIAPGTSPVPEIQTAISDASPGLIQRDIGFEFQTGWGIRERGPLRLGGRRNRQYRRQEVVRDYGGFQFTADEANTPLGAEIEFVVKHIPEGATVNYLNAVMGYLEDFAGDLNAYKDRNSFTLDKATGRKADSQVEIFPKIKTHADISANPQLTGGVRQDRLTQMFQDLSHPHGAHANAQQNLISTGGGGGLGLAAGAVAGLTVNGAPASDKLKGLVAWLVNYLWMGRRTVGPVTVPTLNYGKASLTLLARTDFRKMFTELPGPEQIYLNAHPKRFRNKVLAAAGGLDKDANVLERGIHNVPVPITRDQWLRHIALDHDLLKEETDDRLFGYGEKGNKVDNVGPGNAHSGIILEFRTMRRDVHYTNWAPMATEAWDYLTNLNQ